jgi:hypothetical protein
VAHLQEKERMEKNLYKKYYISMYILDKLPSHTREGQFLEAFTMKNETTAVGECLPHTLL